MLNKLKFIAIIALGMTFSGVEAQVRFQLDLLPDNETYLVSLVPEVNWAIPDNYTATAQVTIKVPTGQFNTTQFTNLQPGVVWMPNSKVDHPGEAPDYDYLSIGLTSLGTSGLTYQVGQTLPLFSFKNAFGCTGKIALVDNGTDAFMPPNSKKVNIGNQITTLGARGEAYIGIVGSGEVECTTVGTTAPIALNPAISVSPNPANERIFVMVNWPGSAPENVVFSFITITGQTMQRLEKQLTPGVNRFEWPLHDISPGVYQIQMEGDYGRTVVERVVVAKQ